LGDKKKKGGKKGGGRQALGGRGNAI